MSDTPTAYFKKELPFNPWTLSDGRKVKVEVINNHIGAVKTSDELEVKELTEAGNAHVGGWYVIDEAEYQELLKKKSPLKPHSRREELTSQGLKGAAQQRATAQAAEQRQSQTAAGNAADAEQPATPPPAPPPKPKVAPKEDTKKGE